MKNKKSLLEEVDKTWKLAKLIEAAGAPVASGQPTQSPQTQQQGQRAPQSTPPPPQGPAANPSQPAQTNPQQVQKNISATMDQGMSALIQQLPAILKGFTTASGDKDGQLEIPGQQAAKPTQQQVAQNANQQQNRVQESAETRELKFDHDKFKSHFEDLNESGIIGLVASTPAIMQLGGKLLSWTGKKTNVQFMQKWGKSIATAGENLHHKYLGMLEKVVAPFMKNATPEERHKASEALFMVLVAGLFAGGLTEPNMLTGVKGKELASYVGKLTMKSLGAMGFA